MITKNKMHVDFEFIRKCIYAIDILSPLLIVNNDVQLGVSDTSKMQNKCMCFVLFSLKLICTETTSFDNNSISFK